MNDEDQMNSLLDYSSVVSVSIKVIKNKTVKWVGGFRLFNNPYLISDNNNILIDQKD